MANEIRLTKNERAVLVAIYQANECEGEQPANEIIAEATGLPIDEVAAAARYLIQAGLISEGTERRKGEISRGDLKPSGRVTWRSRDQAGPSGYAFLGVDFARGFWNRRGAAGPLARIGCKQQGARALAGFLVGSKEAQRWAQFVASDCATPDRRWRFCMSVFGGQ